MSKFAYSFEMDLSKRVDLPNGTKENKKVGTAKVPCPVLADFGIQAEISKDEKGEPAMSNGIPVYADPRFHFLQRAVQSAISVIARNRYSDGKLKPGMVLAEDFEELFSTSDNRGDALVMRREAVASFEKFLQDLGKKTGTIAVLSKLFFNSATSLNFAEATYVEALATQVGRWIEKLDDAQKARFAAKITELQESINNAQKGADLDDMAS